MLTQAPVTNSPSFGKKAFKIFIHNTYAASFIHPGYEFVLALKLEPIPIVFATTYEACNFPLYF
jgi:hypothetical protein